MKEDRMNPPDTTLARDAGSIHPPMVSQFEPKKKLAVPKQGSAKEYAALNDDSASEYAWEFLRRNRFYQAMVDGTRPSFDLAQWGYRPTAAHEAGFGLQRVKHYSEGHDDSLPHWTPIAAMVDRMQDTVAHFKHHQPRIEIPARKSQSSSIWHQHSAPGRSRSRHRQISLLSTLSAR